MVTFDLITADGLDSHIDPVHLRVPAEHVPKLPAPYLRLQNVYVHRFRHSILYVISIVQPISYPTALLKELQISFPLLFGLPVLGVVFQEVVRNIVDRVLRFVFLLSQGRQGLQHQGYYCLVEIGSNWQGLHAVFGRLHKHINT